MKIIRLFFSVFLCWTLLFGSISINKSQYDARRSGSLAFGGSYSLNISVMPASAYAQLDAFTSTAKEKNSNFKTFYLPMLVMLGMGIMAVYMMATMKKKTTDFYVFAIGAVSYLVSVLTSWVGEKKKFEELPESINKDVQIEGLRIQKNAFEDLRKMVKKRIIFQGAALAAFAGAAIMAGLLYTNEKATGLKAQKAFEALSAEAAAKCPQIPLVAAQPPLADATTGVPLAVTCQKNAAAITTGAKTMAKGQTAVNTQNEQVRVQEGSGLADEKATATSNVVSDTMIGLLGPGLRPTHNLEAQTFTMTAQSMSRDEYIEREKDGIYFEKNGKRFVYLPPIKNERFNDPNATFMEKHFSDEELKDFTPEEISYLNENQLNVPLLDLFIKDAMANALVGRMVSIDGVSGGGIGNTVSEAVSDASNALVEPLGLPPDTHVLVADSMAATGSLLAGNEVAKGASKAVSAAAPGVKSLADDAVMKARVAAQMTGGSIASGASKAAGAVARVAGPELTTGAQMAVKATSRSAYTQAATAGTKFVAKRVATAAVVGVATVATGAAAVVSAPVVGAVLTGAAIAYTAYDLYNISNTFMKNTTGKSYGEHVSNGFSRLKSWWNSSVEPPKKYEFDLMDLIIPPAYALGIAAPAVQALQKTTQVASQEADRWIYNPKGRMVLYGAVAVLTALVTKNSVDMEKQLGKDVESLDGMIKELEATGAKSSSFEEPATSFLDKFFDLKWIQDLPIKEAKAVSGPTGKLPFPIPCLIPFRNRCISNKQYVQRSLPPRLKLPPVVMETVARSAQMGDAIQNGNVVTPEFYEHAKKLDSMKGRLIASHMQTKKLINVLQAKKYNQRPIPFDKMENSLAKNFMNIAEKSMKEQGTDVSAIASLFGPISKVTSYIKPLFKNPFSGSSDDQEESYSNFSSDTMASSRMNSGSTENKDYLNKKYKNSTEGINTSKHENLFHQISKKYLLWQTSQGDDF